MRWESSDGDMETNTVLFGLSFQETQIIIMCKIMDMVVCWLIIIIIIAAVVMVRYRLLLEGVVSKTGLKLKAFCRKNGRTEL